MEDLKKIKFKFIQYLYLKNRNRIVEHLYPKGEHFTGFAGRSRWCTATTGIDARRARMTVWHLAHHV